MSLCQAAPALGQALDQRRLRRGAEGGLSRPLSVNWWSTPFCARNARPGGATPWGVVPRTVDRLSPVGAKADLAPVSSAKESGPSGAFPLRPGPHRGHLDLLAAQIGDHPAVQIGRFRPTGEPYRR
jgi:hypothetical protein